MTEPLMIENQKFKTTYQISEDIYTGFMKLFDDNNSLHTDSDYAKSKGFNEKVMHGNILCGFLSNFVGEMLPQSNTIIHNISINFVKPCYVNDIVNLDVMVTEFHKSVSVGILDFKFYSNQTLVAKGTIQIGLI